MVKDAGRYFVVCLLMGLLAASGAQALTIDLVAGTGLSGNPADLRALDLIGYDTRFVPLPT